MRLWVFQTGGLKQNAESSVLKRYSLVALTELRREPTPEIIAFAPLPSNDIQSKTLPFGPKSLRIMGMEKTQISGYAVYDIRDLIATWKSGWQAFAKLGSQLGISNLTQPFGDSSFCEVQRALDGFATVFNYGLCGDCRVLRNIYLYVPDHFVSWGIGFVNRTSDPLFEKSAKYSTRLRDLLRKLIAPFEDSDTLDEALCEKLEAKEIDVHVTGSREYTYPQLGVEMVEGKWGRGTIIFDFENKPKTGFPEDFSKAELGNLLSRRIGKRWAKCMKWLDYGLDSQPACEEAWWNCLWLAAEPKVREMLAVERSVRHEVPLSDEQFKMLNDYIRFGQPSSGWFFRQDGSQTYKLFVEPRSRNPTDLSRYWRNRPFEAGIAALLSQPAFVLAQELQKNCSKPRFVRQCRAPSCGKLFYTGRSNATACPSKQGRTKSACALEWVRYKRCLIKTGKDPEEDWDNEQLKKDFISYGKD